MSSIPVYDLEQKQVATVEIDEGVFGVSAASELLVHGAVRMQRAGQRQGTASTKGRGEVSGSGKKPWKQKHTGRARAGSVRSPIWRHGGTVFGPTPRSYGFQIPKKMYRSAMRAVLGRKLSEGNIIVVDQWSLPEVKTRALARVLSGLGVRGKAVLVVGESGEDLMRIGRNQKNLKVLLSQELNVYDVLWCDKIVLNRSALEAIQRVWG